MKILFGPVSSRRFGRSLGIDLSPSKNNAILIVFTASLIQKAQEKQDEIISIDKIISEVKAMLEKC